MVAGAAGAQAHELAGDLFGSRKSKHCPNLDVFAFAMMHLTTKIRWLTRNAQWQSHITLVHTVFCSIRLSSRTTTPESQASYSDLAE